MVDRIYHMLLKNAKGLGFEGPALESLAPQSEDLLFYFWVKLFSSKNILTFIA